MANRQPQGHARVWPFASLVGTVFGAGVATAVTLVCVNAWKARGDASKKRAHTSSSARTASATARAPVDGSVGVTPVRMDMLSHASVNRRSHQDTHSAHDASVLLASTLESLKACTVRSAVLQFCVGVGLTLFAINDWQFSRLDFDDVVQTAISTVRTLPQCPAIGHA